VAAPAVAVPHGCVAAAVVADVVVDTVAGGADEPAVGVAVPLLQLVSTTAMAAAASVRTPQRPDDVPVMPPPSHRRVTAGAKPFGSCERRGLLEDVIAPIAPIASCAGGDDVDRRTEAFADRPGGGGDRTASDDRSRWACDGQMLATYRYL
jgi:hypothetical protein